MVTECYFCQSPLQVDQLMDFDSYSNGIFEWNKVNPEKNREVIGLQCPHCKVAFCNTAHKKELNFSFWLSGYDKSICPNCGKTLKGGKQIIKITVTRPEAETQLAQQVNPIEKPGIQKIEQAEAGSAPKSIILPIFLLLLFTPLLIFGVVFLFWTWQDGITYIVFSLFCISIAGRMVKASVEEIIEYNQLKKKN